MLTRSHTDVFPQALPRCAQIIEHHRVFLNKVMKGTLLKRKVQLLRTLLDLKAQALKFVEVSAQLQIDHEAMEEEVAEAFAGACSKKEAKHVKGECSAREQRQP